MSQPPWKPTKAHISLTEGRISAGILENYLARFIRILNTSGCICQFTQLSDPSFSPHMPSLKLQSCVAVADGVVHTWSISCILGCHSERKPVSTSGHMKKEEKKPGRKPASPYVTVQHFYQGSRVAPPMKKPKGGGRRR